MRRHMLTHNGTVQTCNICGKNSPNRYALKSHIKRAHQGAQFECVTCGKKLRTATSLKVTKKNYLNVLFYYYFFIGA